MSSNMPIGPDGIPLDIDGVPLWGPMRKYVDEATARTFMEVYEAQLTQTEGSINLSAGRDRVNAAKHLAIAQWRAREAGIHPKG